MKSCFVKYFLFLLFRKSCKHSLLTKNSKSILAYFECRKLGRLLLLSGCSNQKVPLHPTCPLHQSLIHQRHYRLRQLSLWFQYWKFKMTKRSSFTDSSIRRSKLILTDNVIFSFLLRFCKPFWKILLHRILGKGTGSSNFWWGRKVRFPYDLTHACIRQRENLLICRSPQSMFLMIVRFHKRFWRIRLRCFSNIVAWKLVAFVSCIWRCHKSFSRIYIYFKVARQSHVTFQTDMSPVQISKTKKKKRENIVCQHKIRFVNWRICE